MSTYRKRTQPKPTTAAGLRAQASASGNSIFRNRPRSIAGLFASSQNSYSSLLSGGGYSGGPGGYLSKSSSPSDSGNGYKSAYSNSAGNLSSSASYQNPYTTYGGTASGYGALTLPSSGHSSIASSLNLATPSTSYGYLNGLGARPVASVHRGGSFNKPKPKLDAGSFGSRSSSLQSLAGSEGYASGHEQRSGRSSRLGSVSSLSSEAGLSPGSRSKSGSAAPENGELDYKKLYEESQAENERLRDKLRKADEQLKETQGLLDKAQAAAQKSALSETEKRERRAMERKLSEMEEELKMMETLKCENQRLKDENGALIRVISKLSK